MDFYLTYLHRQILPLEYRAEVHMYDTNFYQKLTNVQTEEEKKTNVTDAQRRHCKVSSWTKNLDIFEKNLLVIPICEEKHWYLVLVVKPGLVAYPERQRINGEEEPLILLLDSYYEGYKWVKTVENIRDYLAEEWATKKGVKPKVGAKARLMFNQENMNMVQPERVRNPP